MMIVRCRFVRCRNLQLINWSSVPGHCKASKGMFSEGSCHWAESVISRLQQRHRETGTVTAHADDYFVVNSALRKWMMNATQLQAHLREVRATQHALCAGWPCKGTWTYPQAQASLSCMGQGAFALDEEPVDLSAVLWWKSIHIEQNWWPSTLLETLRRKLCISYCCHQTSLWRCWWCYSLGRWVCSIQNCPVNGTVTSRYYLNNIINPVIVPLHEQHRPDFILMDDNVLAH